MKIRIEINCDNAAFEDDMFGEVNRILGEKLPGLSSEIAEPGDSYPLMDINGNKVGTLTVEE